MSKVIEENFNYYLTNHFLNYQEGEWLAIYNNNVISHGEKLEKVVSASKKVASVSKILFSKVRKTARYL